MEQLTQFVSKSFEEGGATSAEGWGAGSSRSSVSPLVDPEDSRSEPPSSPAVRNTPTTPPPQSCTPSDRQRIDESFASPSYVSMHSGPAFSSDLQSIMQPRSSRGYVTRPAPPKNQFKPGLPYHKGYLETEAKPGMSREVEEPRPFYQNKDKLLVHEPKDTKYAKKANKTAQTDQQPGPSRELSPVEIIVQPVDQTDKENVKVAKKSYKAVSQPGPSRPMSPVEITIRPIEKTESKRAKKANYRHSKRKSSEQTNWAEFLKSLDRLKEEKQPNVSGKVVKQDYQKPGTSHQPDTPHLERNTQVQNESELKRKKKKKNGYTNYTSPVGSSQPVEFGSFPDIDLSQDLDIKPESLSPLFKFSRARYEQVTLREPEVSTSALFEEMDSLDYKPEPLPPVGKLHGRKAVSPEGRNFGKGGCQCLQCCACCPSYHQHHPSYDKQSVGTNNYAGYAVPRPSVDKARRSRKRSHPQRFLRYKLDSELMPPPPTLPTPTATSSTTDDPSTSCVYGEPSCVIKRINHPISDFADANFALDLSVQSLRTSAKQREDGN
ncbi:uncharacterized protein LOC106664105 [Cimex lectularius]|uniref:Uncharacterized protein n=1 Tax=Cimex lectularius TaxID=79782 RepID=A0A8I6RG86_CIMLE|nr:uncharacterized protein LOC106664105 [Cimex lectularius]